MLPPLAAGHLFALKYRIERLIGSGGMGAVYAAKHELLNQTVAIKFLYPDIAENPTSLGRFLNEARAAARIRGEHVAAVLDVDTTDEGTTYIVLEYLEGADLEALVGQRGPLPADEACDYLLQALEALAQAHALGIVHRDIKPSNLFLAKRLDGSDILKVLDFGISKAPRFAQPIEGSSTESEALLGSPGYMSPEQVRSAKNVDARTDVWAVGVVLYRLLTGKQPFVGETIGAMLAAIIEHHPPSIRELRPELPEGLEAVVARCLSKDPGQRYANVAELGLALEPYAGGRNRRSVEEICRTLRVPRGAEPIQAGTQIVADAAGQASPIEAAAQPAGPSTASSWAESRSTPRARRRRSARATTGIALLLAATAIGAVVMVAMFRSPRTVPTAGSAVAPLSSPTTSVALSPIAASDELAVPAVTATPSASASATIAPPPTPSTKAAAASKPATTPPPVKTAAPKPSAAPVPASSYDILNRRN
jgi:serine/threonine-protein kinase